MGAITGVKCGSVRTRIQRQGSGKVAAARECIDRGRGLSVGVSESTLEGFWIFLHGNLKVLSDAFSPWFSSLCVKILGATIHNGCCKR
jgi:hypothetical protein